MALVILWMHVMAAVVWIGGMVFLSTVAVPVLKPRSSGLVQADLFLAMARRFRLIVWMAIATLLTTGPVLLFLRGLSLLEPAQWPGALSLKLSLVALLLILTGAHDLLIGPRVARIAKLPAERRGWTERGLVMASPWLARLSLLLAVGIVGVAMTLSRT
jgi:uncharacterized membrane protein